MLTLASLAQQVDSPAANDFDAVIDKAMNRICKAQFPRLAIDHREEDH